MTGSIPGMAGSEGAAGSGGLVLVLNSGSSSVKFALLTPDTGERVLGGLAEQVGTPRGRAADPPVSRRRRLRAAPGRQLPGRHLPHSRPPSRRRSAARRRRPGSHRRRPPGRARGRPVQRLDAGGRRGHRRDPRVRPAGAAAQPGEPGRHRGGQRHPARTPAGSRVRHRVPPDHAGRRLPLRGARGVVHPVRGAALRVPRHQPPFRQRTGGGSAQQAARRAAPGHRPSRQRLQRRGDPGRRVGGHHDGTDPDGGAGHGDPLRRCRSRRLRLPGQPDRADLRGADPGAEHAERPAGAVRCRQRHAGRRGRGRAGRRAGPARPRGLRAPAGQGDRRAGHQPGTARRAGLHRRHRGEQPGRPRPGPGPAWGSSAWPRTPRPTPGTAGPPGGGSAVPARSRRSWCRPTRS